MRGLSLYDDNMTFHIITLFPEVFDAYFKESVIGKAIQKKKIYIKLYNLRDFSLDTKRRKARPAGRRSFRRVDDRAYGGGPGMVLEVGPVVKAIEKATKNRRQAKVILFSAGGKQFDFKMAKRLTGYRDIVLVAGRYEGVDERVKKIFSARGGSAAGGKAEEVSIGPYVLTGGEVPAMAVVDAVARQIKGVLGKEESLEETRYGVGVPVYTRPEVFKYRGKEYKVPKVLLSGDHKRIDEWRKRHRKKY